MANARQMETSLLTEHLRYTPLTLIDDIINTINILITRAIDACESGLLSASPSTLGFVARASALNQAPALNSDGTPQYPEMRAEIEEGVHQLETLLATNVDRNFDKFEIFALRNIFTVEEGLVPWVRLGHYEGVDVNAVKAPDAPTLEGVRMARRKLLETRKLNRALEVERARNEKLLGELREITGTRRAMKTEETGAAEGQGKAKADFSFLASAPSAQALGLRPLSPETAQQGQTPLTTNTSFTLAQLPALKVLVEELRPKVAALQSMDASAGQGRFARERSEYVETQTMRILERRGVDLNEVSAPSETSGPGRRIGREEVEAIERVVSAMGGNTARRRADDDAVNGAEEDAMEED